MTQQEDIADFKKHWFKRTLQLLLLIAILFGMLHFAVGEEYKTYTVTAYCACKKCCGKWADGYTANGSKATEGVTCAASRKIPFGTKLQIEGVGVRVVQDRLALKYDNRIDIYFNSHQKALDFGKKTCRVKIIMNAKEIDMTKLSAHEMLEMFRRGEHLKKNSDAYFLYLITQSAILQGNENRRQS